jgi:hypothetical protein
MEIIYPKPSNEDDLYEEVIVEEPRRYKMNIKVPQSILNYKAELLNKI